MNADTSGSASTLLSPENRPPTTSRTETPPIAISWTRTGHVVIVERDLGMDLGPRRAHADLREVERDLALASRRGRELAVLALPALVQRDRDLAARAGELDELVGRRLLHGQRAA